MKRPAAKRVLRIVIIVVLFFLVLEGASRLYFRHSEWEYGSPVLSPDQRSYWKPRGTGRLGTAQVPKDRGVFRIVTIGDSSTYGTGVEENETYSALLPARLEGKIPCTRIEALKGGVPGYSTHQGMQRLKDVLLPFRPDVVIINFLNCDIHPEVSTDRGRPQDRGVVSAMKSVLYQSDFYYLLRMETLKLRQERPDGPHRLFMRVPLDDYGRNLRDMAAETRRAGGRPIFVIPPNAWFSPPHGRYRNEIRKAASKTQSPLADLYSEWTRRGSRGLYEDPCHPSVEGHRLIAGTLASTILRMLNMEKSQYFESCPPLGGRELIENPVEAFAGAIFPGSIALERHSATLPKSLRKGGPVRDFFTGTFVTKAPLKDVVRYYLRAQGLPFKGYLKEGERSTLVLGDQGISGFFSQDRPTMDVDIVTGRGMTEIDLSASRPARSSR